MMVQKNSSKVSLSTASQSVKLRAFLFIKAKSQTACTLPFFFYMHPVTLCICFQSEKSSQACLFDPYIMHVCTFT